MVEQIITKGYAPEKVFAYFEQLCKIPHGSGNEEAVARYIENFALERGLFVIRDKNNNVFIPQYFFPFSKIHLQFKCIPFGDK